jgi:hypothetical protein
MPRAYTLEEKREKALAAQQPVQEPAAPAKDGTIRRKRSVFNGTTGKLKVDGQIPGFHLHILNDHRTRIKDALDNGYEFVTPEEIEGVTENVVSRNGDLGDSRIRFLVGTDERGQPMYAYLMKLRQEWYEEDQAVLQERNDKIDSAIRGGRINPETNNSNYYVPRDGIKLQT